MRKILVALTFLFTLHSFAETNSELYIGPKYKRSNVNLKGFGTFNGNEWGFTAGYQYKRDWAFYARVYLEGTFGTVNQRNSSNRMGMTDLFGGLQIGYVAAFGKCIPFQMQLIPYLGYAYHYIKEENKFPGFAEVDYEYLVPFLPFGIFYNLCPLKQFCLSLHGEYQYNLETYLDISTLRGARWKLNRKPSWLVELFATWVASESFSISLIPFYNVFRSGRSTAVTATGLTLGIQPQTYSSYGGKIDLSYHF